MIGCPNHQKSTPECHGFIVLADGLPMFDVLLIEGKAVTQLDIPACG